MFAAAARWAHETLRPAPGHNGLTALLLRAVALLKPSKAQPLAELDRIARHGHLLVAHDSAHDLRNLRQIRGHYVEEVG